MEAINRSKSSAEGMRVRQRQKTVDRLKAFHVGDELVELPLRLAILLVCFLESEGASMDGGIRDWVVHN